MSRQISNLDDSLIDAARRSAVQAEQCRSYRRPSGTGHPWPGAQSWSAWPAAAANPWCHRRCSGWHLHWSQALTTDDRLDKLEGGA